MYQSTSFATQHGGPVLGDVQARPRVDDSLMGLKTLISILNSNATEETLLLMMNNLLILARDRGQHVLLLEAGIIAPLVWLSDFGLGEVKTRALAFLVILAKIPVCRDAIINVWYPLVDPSHWIFEQPRAFTPSATKPAPTPMEEQPLNHCLPYMHAPKINEGHASRMPSPPFTPTLTSTPLTPSVPASMFLLEEAQETLRVESAPCADSYACEDLYLCVFKAIETKNEQNHPSEGIAKSFAEGTAEKFADGVVDCVAVGVAAGAAAGEAAGVAAGEAAGVAAGMGNAMLDESAEWTASPASVRTTVLYDEGDVSYDEVDVLYDEGDVLYDERDVLYDEGDLWQDNTAAASGDKTTAESPRATEARSMEPQSVLQRKRWSDVEDVVLCQAVETFGSGNWAMVSQALPGRTCKQCRERWRNHLRSGVCKDAWSDGEKRRLDDLFMLYGRRWATIAKYLPGRTDSAVKNMWYATNGITKPRASKPVSRFVRKRI